MEYSTAQIMNFVGLAVIANARTELIVQKKVTFFLFFNSNIYFFLFLANSDFLDDHALDEYKDYIELIKRENNINAKNGKENNWSALHKGILFDYLIMNLLFIQH